MSCVPQWLLFACLLFAACSRSERDTVREPLTHAALREIAEQKLQIGMELNAVREILETQGLARNGAYTSFLDVEESFSMEGQFGLWLYVLYRCEDMREFRLIEWWVDDRTNSR